MEKKKFMIVILTPPHAYSRSTSSTLTIIQLQSSNSNLFPAQNFSKLTSQEKKQKIKTNKLTNPVPFFLSIFSFSAQISQNEFLNKKICRTIINQNKLK